MTQVHTDITLAGILLMIVAGDIGNVGSPQAGDIAVRWLDLDHVSTEVTQHATGKRTCQNS